MKITPEPVRCTSAVAEIIFHVELSGPATECAVRGRAVGPRCENISTVEVAYPFTVEKVSDNVVSLKCVIPEPNLWTREAPFGYATSFEVRVNGELTDTRGGTITLPKPKG
ncbi:MAG: hypothetical protein L0241_11605 [Planctomycetia bacterium]|nr:hypothetical protein [Planctomycetia bacterium]